MTEFKKLLDWIDRNRDRIWMQKGVSEKEINDLEKNINTSYGNEILIPEDYRTFLSIINGLSYNDKTIHSIGNDIFTDDILKSSVYYYGDTGLTNQIFIGHSSIDYVIYDNEKNKYIIISPGGILVKEFSNLESLLVWWFGIEE